MGQHPHLQSAGHRIHVSHYAGALRNLEVAAPPHASCLLRVQQVAKPAELLDYLTLSYYGYSGQVASQNEIL